MLRRLKSVFGSGSDFTHAEYVASLDLDSKPFTKALFLRAAMLLDQARRDFKSEGVEVQVDQYKSIADFAHLAASTIAYDVTVQAANENNVPVVFLPYEAVPKHASLIVAFGMYLALGFHIRLEEEGVSTSAQEMLGRTAMQFFSFHPEAASREQFAKAFAVFRDITATKHPIGDQWKEACVNLVLPYALQWTTTDQKLKCHDYPKLFGNLLQMLLKASNSR